jgi:hypothetical protein
MGVTLTTHPHIYSAEVNNEQELYILSPFEPACRGGTALLLLYLIKDHSVETYAELRYSSTNS